MLFIHVTDTALPCYLNNVWTIFYILPIFFTSWSSSVYMYLNHHVCLSFCQSVHPFLYGFIPLTRKAQGIFSGIYKTDIFVQDSYVVLH